MASYKKKTNFLETDAGDQARELLHGMETDIRYSTSAYYSASLPDNTISFVDKHMTYLNDHPNVNPDYYLANLRLMSRIK